MSRSVLPTRPHTRARPPEEKHPCPVCGFKTFHRPTCSTTCSENAKARGIDVIALSKHVFTGDSARLRRRA